jgi:signal transduction histidine kinase
MRRQLVMVALATTLTVTIAFVVPLAILVRVLAAERALGDADRVIRTLIPVLVSGDESAASLTVEQLRATTTATLSVHLPDGRVLGADVSDDDVETARAGSAIARTDADGSRVSLTPVVRQTGGTSVIRVSVPASLLTLGVWPALRMLAAIGVGLVIVAVLIADRLGRRAVTQATAVAAAARRLASGDGAARAPEGGTPELADAAGALNTLADRIDALIAAEREAAADVSHRLRTPMTALRLDIDALPPSAATERVVQDLLALDIAVDRVIRSARGAVADVEGVASDAARVTRERSEFWSALAQDEGRPWRCESTDQAVFVPLDAERLAVVLDALLGNVLSHTDPPAGCHISVTGDHGQVRIRIDDDGPGFDPAATARGRSGGGSTGLGLDIARRTVEAAGGSLHIGGRAGGGRVEVRLPRVG